MRIIGIDPGIAAVGIGIVDTSSPHDFHVEDWCVITTAAGAPLPQRLQEIAKDLTEILRETKPDLAVVERLFFATNAQTAIDVAQARGAILLTLAMHALLVLEPTPMQLKVAITGDGHADKAQIQSMLSTLLSLASPPKPDDAADALALAIFGAITQQTRMCAQG